MGPDVPPLSDVHNPISRRRRKKGTENPNGFIVNVEIFQPLFESHVHQDRQEEGRYFDGPIDVGNEKTGEGVEGEQEILGIGRQ